MVKIIIVGAGIFGRVTARTLLDAGCEVQLFDNNAPHSGSKAAGCLMKPSWAGSISKTNYAKSTDHLNKLYGLEKVNLKLTVSKITKISKNVEVDFIRPCKIMQDSSLTNKVSLRQVEKIEFVGADKRLVVHYKNLGLGEKIDGAVDFEETDFVIVCAGYLTEKLVNLDSKQVTKAGVVFTQASSHKDVYEETMNFYLPYKQAVFFKREVDEYWGNDGTSVDPDKLTEGRVQQCYDRVTTNGSFNDSYPIKPIVGHRPVPVNKFLPYILEQKPEYNNRLIAFTGGGKNGTLAASLGALELATLF